MNYTFNSWQIFFKYIALILTLILPQSAIATDIQVKVDRASIQLNQPFTLVFEAKGDTDDEPDFSPLEQNFKLLGQSRSSSSNINLNTRGYTKIVRWQVNLIPLRKGSITIPSIQFGSDKSPQHTIQVKSVQQSNGKAGEDFISELILDKTNVYPQSQVIITQRMLSTRSISAFEFSDIDYSGVDIVIEPLGETKQYQTQRGDTPYLVLERRFVLYPQSSGTLNIEPSIASARIAMSGRSPFNSFRSNTETIRRASSQKTLMVKSIPDSFTGSHWLPAKEVQLVEEFPDNRQHIVGEPITRTLSLFVDGQSASQLPEFSLPEIENLKQYPDKPLLNNNTGDDGVTGAQQIKVAIIPAKKGSFTLPEISIPWWNTVTDTLEYATLPEKTFTVSDPLSADLPTIPQVPLPEIKPAPAADNSMQDLDEINASESNTVLWKVLSLFLSIGWIITLFLFWKSRTNTQPIEVKTKSNHLNPKQLLQEIEKACNNSDAKACKSALLNWANQLFEEPVYSLGELSRLVTPPLQDRVQSLNKHLYKNISDNWHCEDLYELCQAFTANISNKTNNRPDDQLEELYR